MERGSQTDNRLGGKELSSESVQRGTRAKKEAYILQLVMEAGKIRTTELYGQFSRRFPGAAIRTFLNEYLTALEYRGEIILHVEGTGYFVYNPEVFDKTNGGSKRPEPE